MVEGFLIEGASYELVGGPVGNRGLMTCVYGGVTRAFAPRYRDEHNTRGEFYVDINAPTESLLFDLLVHVDVAQEIDVTADVLLGSSPSEGARALSTRIPVEEQVRRLESVPPRVSTPLVPRYEEIVRRVHERMGWAPASFRALRFEMKCPPLPSQIVLHYELPAGPRA